MGNTAPFIRQPHSWAKLSKFTDSRQTIDSAGLETAADSRPNSALATRADYWIALGHLFLEEYEEARSGFQALAHSNAIPGIREDSAYRQGVAEYGLNDYPAAIATFRKFQETYPDSALAAEALAMIGDMQAAEGLLDEALASYTEAMHRATNSVQGDYAAFQMARTFELEGRWQEILGLFEEYLELFGESANITQAAYWRGNALNQMGKPAEARRSFIDTVLTHGNDPDADGIDFIIRDLIEEFNGGRVPVQEREALTEELIAASRRAEDLDQRTLELRLLGLEHEVSRNEKRKEKISGRLLREENLPDASPGVLALMGSLGKQQGEDELTLLTYQTFLERYPESDLSLDALVGLAERHMEAGEWSEALPYFVSITERYPTLPQAAEAHLRLADIYRKLDEPEKAVETYTLILSVKDWRGPLWPTALLRLGDTRLEQGKAQEAFGYYQRVYVMYAGYPELAAEAYLHSARILEKQGKSAEVKRTLQEMLDQPALAEQPIAREARVLLMAQP